MVNKDKLFLLETYSVRVLNPGNLTYNTHHYGVPSPCIRIEIHNFFNKIKLSSFRVRPPFEFDCLKNITSSLNVQYKNSQCT